MKFINSPNEIIRDWYKKRKLARDLFGRMKVTMLNPQFTYQNEYNKGELQWVEKITGTASATHDPTDATVKLKVSAAGDKIIRQTIKYMRYFSGKSSQCTMTFYTDAMDADTVFRAGYFDDHNGVFFERDDSTEYVVVRNNGVDQKTERSEWNRDILRGFDFDKSVILQINLQWLGVGVVQFIVQKPNGELVIVHENQGSGFLESTYMRTANLPIRYELEATAEYAGSGSEAKQICAAYGHEDGSCGEVSKYRHTANNGITAASVTTTKRAIIAIRPKAEFEGIANRSDVRPSAIDLLVGGANIQWETVYNPTLTGEVTWISAGDDSPIEYSVDVNTYTGGTIFRSGFVSQGSGNTRTAVSSNVQDNYPLGLDVDGANPTSIAIVARSFSGTATVSAAIGFEEIY